MKAIATIVAAVLMATFSPSFAQSPAVPSQNVMPAVDGVLALFQKKPVVVMCDYHGLAQEEDFYSALVRDPRFAETVGNVVVEFGGESAQQTIDRYVGGEDVPAVELRRVWTETPGWVPGPTRLGYINFFASVRAANLRLPPERRIKIWLGEPKIDWTTIHSSQDLQPYIAQRDDNYVRIIGDEILAKNRKTLLIIGLAHIFGAGPLRAKLNQAFPKAFATAVAFIGYVEPECNARFVARAKGWPVPATISAGASGSLKSLLEAPGCNFLHADTIAAIRRIPPAKFPPGISSADEMLQKDICMASGRDADAILYLGPPDSLTESPYDPAIYLDSTYSREQDRRLRCCYPAQFQGRMDLDRLLRQNSAAPQKLQSIF